MVRACHNTVLYFMYLLRHRCEYTIIIVKLLNEDVVEKLIRHEAQPSASSGLETTPKFTIVYELKWSLNKQFCSKNR